MIMLKHYLLARLVAPLFLLMALFAEAWTTQSPNVNSSPASTSSSIAPYPPLPTVLCDSLPAQTPGVQQRLRQYVELVKGRQCIVLAADPTEDLSETIKRAPENTVILLSSETVSTASSTSTSSLPPVDKTPIEYLINKGIVLKDGQDIIGAADDGFEIVIRVDAGFKDLSMVMIDDMYDFDKTRDSHIRHVTFQPVGPENNVGAFSIIYAGCYNRKLIVENNLFYVSVRRAGLFLSCAGSLDASVNQGSGLQFANNVMIGKSILYDGSDIVPKGIDIYYAGTQQLQKIAVIENIFQGEMAHAGDFYLPAGSSMDIFRNTVDINNNMLGKKPLSTRPARFRDGFFLRGNYDTKVNLLPPLFNLAGNRIRSKSTAIGIEGHIKLALACNHLQAANPWRQYPPSWWWRPKQYGLKAVDPLPLAGECEGTADSTGAVVTPTSPTVCQVFNTWTSIDGSMINPLSGLDSLDGRLFSLDGQLFLMY
ncbi:MULTISPECIES: hypothetical protein [unclassified Endozoicomonas]|uniref:hypothetical protein n=2 Tax=unclassified Endozoicomonas TaxID=2644528 RepID=UPI0021482FA9|nr:MULTISPECIES: hypothetical protein [unclassified Endozoicomonas]